MQMKCVLVSLLFMSILIGCSASAGDTTIKFAIGEWAPYTGEKI